jgi:anti-repressor protein
MEELIKLKKQDGRIVVSARELHKFLEATERFSNWIDRQFQYGFEENIDYVGCKEFNALANQELSDYALTLDCGKEISMLQKNEKGKQARQYFIACENKLKEIVQHQLPKSFAEALQLAADQAKQIELQGCQIKELEPKAEVYDNISNAGNLLSMNDAAKSLSWGRNNFIKRLKSLKILMTSGRPYQQFLDQGYFEVKINPIVKGGIIDNYSQTFVTGKGITWLSKIKI